MVRPWKDGNYVTTSEIGNWSVFVSLGWRFVFAIIMKWDGREPHIVRCYHDSGKIKSCFSPTSSEVKVGNRQGLRVPGSKIGRPARGYSCVSALSPHMWRRRQTIDRWSWVRISRPPWKRFLKKSVFPHVKNLMNRSPWVPSCLLYTSPSPRD